MNSIVKALIFIFFLPSICSFAQAPNLGGAETFTLFTASGAFNGDPATSIVGDIGTDVGAYTPPGFLVGQVHVSDPVSAQAASDVMIAYADLAGRICGAVIGVGLGNGQLLTPNIYCTGAASTINGNLTLDAGGDPTAIFIFQINGALATTVNSTITLINGASLCNVYWQINGELDLGENSVFRGTALVEGAINLLAGADLYGRALSTAGAISTDANVVQLSNECLCDLVVNCPTPSNVQFQCVATIPPGLASDVTIVEACGVASVVITETFSGVGCVTSPYVLIRTYTVTDEEDNSTNCVVTYTAIDNTAPLIVCPTVTPSVECPAMPNFPAATASDLCSADPLITFSTTTIQGICPQEYTIIGTWMATDDCGNSAQCSRSILVTDNTAPVIVCPTLPASFECPITPSFPSATAIVLCSANPIITFTTTTIPGICPQEYNLVRTWTATDDCGNTSQCSRSILVTDNTAPVIVCPTLPVSFECPVTPSFPTATASDLCSANPVITFSTITTPGLCPQEYSMTRTWTATDECGNSAQCSRSILVTDNTAPVIVCPTVTASVECPATPNFPLATASDLCSSNPLVTFTTLNTPGICPQEYTLIRTWTATDECGNSSQCSRSIQVTDNTAPIIVCPIVTASVECPATPNFPPATASDLCSANPLITFTTQNIPGLCPQEYTLIRTWTAVDECGNSAQCSRSIQVTDNTAPIIVCPVVEASVECPATSAFPPATASDLCSANPLITFTTENIPGLCPQEYTLIRTWTAVDECGNSAQCSRSIQVSDNTAPIIVCPVVEASVECPATSAFPPATASDLCSANPLITFTTENIPGLCPQEYTLIRTWTAVDECGNSAQCSRSIQVTDNTAPIIVCPTVTASVECPATPNFPTATASDLCSANPVVTFTTQNIPGICPQEYTLIRTWTAVDECGNSAQCSRSIQVTDNTAPIIVCPIVTASVECPATPNFPPATASDLCSPNPLVTFTTQNIPGLCPQEYTLIRTWTAVDECGNSAQCSRSIQVTDNTAPIIVCPIVTASVECPATPNFPPATASDLCSPNPLVTFTTQNIPGLCPQEYTLIRTWTAVDECGNSSQCSRSIQVTDNTAPIIVCPIVTASVECPATPNFPPATASDLCSANPLITFTTQNIPGICPQEYTLIRTWTAVDDCGNSAQCSRSIQVTDNTAPIIVCPIVTASVECPATPNFLTATASDLCSANPLITFTTQNIAGICPQEYTLIRTWTAVDACGNSAQCSRSIQVTDNTAPVFNNLPSNELVECFFVPPVPANPTATDACSGPATVVFLGETQTPGICPVLYTLTRIWRATDVCGNSVTASQVVTVQDNFAPQLDQSAVDVVLECDLVTNQDAYQNWLDNHGGAVVFDCSEVTWTYENSPFLYMPSICGGTEQHYIRFIATDLCGNSNFWDARFIIIDSTPPKFDVLPQNLNVECIQGDQGEGVLPDWLDNFGYATVSDKCGSVKTEVVLIQEKRNCGFTYTRTYEFRATDECGNTNFVRANFSVVDTTAPVIESCPPGNVSLTCEFDVPSPDTAAVLAYDNCDGPISVSVQQVFTYGTGCSFTTAYTYAVADACGNISTCYQSFQVSDTMPPVYTGLDTIAVLCVDDLPIIGDIAGYLAPYFSDNCYDIVCVNEGLLSSGVNWVTYCIKAKDWCVNWTEKFFITFVATGGCKPLCTVTQTTWGNPNGLINGMTTSTAIDQLISKYGDVMAGKLGKTIAVSSTNCLQSMLPGVGNTVQFASGNHEFGLDNQCNPTSPLLNSDGTLKNMLAANALALQLNIWYNREFNERELGAQTMASLPACLVDPIVLSKIETGHDNIKGLLQLVNDYLAGVGFFPPNFGNPLNAALENVNAYWQNCQLNNPCTSSVSVAGYLKTAAHEPLELAGIRLDRSNADSPMQPVVSNSNELGYYEFSSAVPLLGNYTLTPSSEALPALNGVTTYDLVFISKHILGLAPLQSPYQMIAADVNKSGSITTVDISELRKLILGLYETLPENNSWRFVDQSFVFPNVYNPFATVFPEQISALNIQTNRLAEDFVSIKIGDVNGSAQANAHMLSEARDAATLLFSVDNRMVTAGEVFQLHMQADQLVQCFQFTLNTAGLDVLDVSGNGLSAGSYAVYGADGLHGNAKAALTASWSMPAGASQELAQCSITCRATQSGQLRDMLSLSNRITKTEAHRVFNPNANEALPMAIALRFQDAGHTSISGLGFELYQNVPNPFVDKTTIGFYLPEATTATLKVFDQTGRLVYQQKGDFEQGYNAIALEFELLQTNGAMFYQLETANVVATKRMAQAK